ncbi:MAG: endonuclease/exonuclease/phosphatase family protein [Acidimicrobiia bacterium]
MERIRIMTANLWADRGDASAFADQVTHYAPDVVCTQELSPAAADHLAGMYPYGELEPSHDFRGMGIALNRPGKVTSLELPHKSGLIAVLDPEDWPTLSEPLEIINMHFAAPGPRKPVSAHSARRAQWAGFSRYLESAPVHPRMVIGDMNSTPLWPLYRRLAGRFEDAHRTVAKRYGRLPRRTWGPNSRWPRLLRIDHVFVDGVKVSDLWVIPVAGSDHSAIVFDL